MMVAGKITLASAGKPLGGRIGDHGEGITTVGMNLHAWDLPQRPDPNALDLDRYAELLLRTAHTNLQPLGVKEETLRWWLFSNAGYGAPPGELRDKGLPFFKSQGDASVILIVIRRSIF